VIDFLFHLPLEIAGAILAYCFFSLFRSYRSEKPVGATPVEGEVLTEGAVR
jgi:hypothetical protein